MSSNYDTIAPPARRRAPLIVGLIAFLAGLLLAGWALSRWETGRKWISGESAAQERQQIMQPAQPVAMQPVAAAPVGPIDQGAADALGQRVVEIESRIDRVAERANAAGDNAARAEGLLIAFAARRALDRGLGLGYIEAQLRERFGATQPQAVATVIAASRQPVTLDELQLGLDDLAPGLTSGAGEGGWWRSIGGELSRLVIVRKVGTPSSEPTERLRHARRLLEGGQVDKALVEVARLPGRAKAGNWMMAARQYIQTRQALDVLETAAILTPKAPVTPPPLLPDPAPAQ